MTHAAPAPTALAFSALAFAAGLCGPARAEPGADVRAAYAVDPAGRVLPSQMITPSQEIMPNGQADGERAVAPTPRPRPAANPCAHQRLPAETVRALVLRIAAEEQVDPRLAEAIAEAESDFGRHMLSPAGAKGILQLMPETGAAYGARDRCDPEANVRAGLRYLRDLLAEFEHPVLALAAYNAGPNRIYQHRGVPLFPETVRYVARVLNHWQDFDRTLPARRPSGTERLRSDRPSAPALPAPAQQARAEAAWVDGHVIHFD
jgi:soluble lytic murein transglycosylase-like protein